MSSDLLISYRGPVAFQRFITDTRDVLAHLLCRPTAPELLVFSAPGTPSTRPAPQSLGPETDCWQLGFAKFGGSFELLVVTDGPSPEFELALRASPPLGCAATISAAVSLARLSGTPVRDPNLSFTKRFESHPDQFLEDVQKGARSDAIRAAAESLAGGES